MSLLYVLIIEFFFFSFFRTVVEKHNHLIKCLFRPFINTSEYI